MKFENIFNFTNLIHIFIIICVICRTKPKKENVEQKLISFGNEITIKINNKGEHQLFGISYRYVVQKI